MTSWIALALFCILSTHFGCLTAMPATDNAKENKDSNESLKQFDNLDIDQILSNDSLVDNRIKCFLNSGPCTQEASDFKKALPLFFDGCKDCNDSLMKKISKAIAFLQTKRAPEWAQMIALYDPTGVSLGKFYANHKSAVSS